MKYGHVEAGGGESAWVAGERTSGSGAFRTTVDVRGCPVRTGIGRMRGVFYPSAPAAERQWPSEPPLRELWAYMAQSLPHMVQVLPSRSRFSSQRLRGSS